MGHSQKHVRLKKPQSEVKNNVTSIESIAEVGCHIVTTKDHQFLEAISTESLGVNVFPKFCTCKIR